MTQKKIRITASSCEYLPFEVCIRTDKELHHKVQEQSPEVRYKQKKQWACGDASTMDAAAKKLQILKHGCFIHTCSTLQHRKSKQSANFQNVFVEHYDVAVKMTLKLLDVKCHHFMTFFLHNWYMNS